MWAELKITGDVVAHCPDCGARSTFEARTGGTQHGRIERQGSFQRDGRPFSLKAYQLLECASCGRGGLATILYGVGNSTLLEAFSPLSAEPAPLPNGTPNDIAAEVREAERCAAIGAWRAASAMLRSALEKTLKANGYTASTLAQKIDEAAADGVITEAREYTAERFLREAAQLV